MNDIANPPVRVSVRESTGVLTLDRPKALNSLNPEMVGIIAGALADWKDDPAIEQVIVHTDGKHFCSGGDVRHAREGILAGNHDDVDTFFATEYAMNLAIAEFPKPYIALMNGVVMGGGLGISAHGSHRVITPETWCSMPEMNIGYITDVGMSHTLQNLPGHPSQALGTFLALTGYRMKAGDMMATGLATHHVDSIDGLIDAIVEHGPVAIEWASTEPAPAESSDLFALIDDSFTGPWSEISERLTGQLKDIVEELTAKASPSALVAAAELMQANSTEDVAQSLENERILGELIRREPDFVEGVRAVLVDKDQEPNFAPAAPALRYREVLQR